jgi:hypothetical protein
MKRTGCWRYVFSEPRSHRELGDANRSDAKMGFAVNNGLLIGVIEL